MRSQLQRGGVGGEAPSVAPASVQLIPCCKARRDQPQHQVASMVPEVIASMVFDDMPFRNVIWDDEFQHAFDSQNLLQQISQGIEDQLISEKIVFGQSHPPLSAGEPILGREGVNVLVQRHAGHLAHQVFEVMPQLDVVWDVELQQLDGEMDGPLEFEHAMFKASNVSNSDVAFEELSNQVVWDDELLQEIESDDSILKILAQGECLIAMDDKPLAELVSFKVSVVTSDDEGELFDGKNCTDVIWDEEPHHGCASHGLLQRLAEAMDNQMQGKQEVSVDILSDKVLWDATPTDIDTHQGLLQKLAQSGDYCDEMKCMDDELNQDLLSVPETHGSLLQQVAWNMKHFDYKLHHEVVWDEMSNTGMHIGLLQQVAFNSKGTENTTVHPGLLQQLAWGKEAFDSEIRQPELVCEELLTDVCKFTVSIHCDMQLSNQVCKSEFFVDAYLLKIKYKQAYVSLSQWDPGIPSNGIMAHEKQQLEIHRMLERQWDPGVLKARGIFFSCSHGMEGI